jgi:hypothetical protein
MMGASMIRSVQNVAVVHHYVKEDPDLVYEVTMEAAMNAGWKHTDEGLWIDPDDPDYQSETDPLELLFQHNLPEALEDEILDKLEGELGRKHPKCMSLDSDVEGWRSLPLIPDRRLADGYEAIKHFFVDSSGFGQAGEPALTFDQFEGEAMELISERVNPTFFAITEAGQFQVHISAFGREEGL